MRIIFVRESQRPRRDPFPMKAASEKCAASEKLFSLIRRSILYDTHIPQNRKKNKNYSQQGSEAYTLLIVSELIYLSRFRCLLHTARTVYAEELLRERIFPNINDDDIKKRRERKTF